MKILIAVVAYNEEKNLPAVFKDLAEHNFGYDVVLIDNGSSDETAKVAAEHGIPCVRHCVNTGSASGTLRAYFEYAHRYNYDILCQFDGDGQHFAAKLPLVITPIQEDRADYVIGSRFLKKEGFQSTALRRMGITLMANIASRSIGFPFTDITSGFRAYSKRVIDYIAMQYPYEIHDTLQLAMVSSMSGARFAEVPIIMQERIHGTSEYNISFASKYMLKSLVNSLGCKLQMKKRKK
ncbi:MAG: glycosyltransferase family 2 protein [Candidatus Cloacimonetes bacterium]|nr:glycosyltransferase family 2 protein [Candidatus Cloacimonadota bacterium]